MLYSQGQMLLDLTGTGRVIFKPVLILVKRNHLTVQNRISASYNIQNLSREIRNNRNCNQNISEI
jgi:hypothetical protein